MPLNQDKPIRFASVGMNDRMQNTLRLFFKGPCKNRCVLVQENSAEACIVDLDAYRGQEMNDEYKQRHPDQPRILISLSETKVDDAIFLLKPLNSTKVIEALDEISNKLDTLREEQAAKGVEPAPKPLAATRTAPVKAQAGTTPTKIHSASQVSQSERTLDEKEIESFVGSAPDIKPTNPKQVAQAQYDASTFLQGFLQQAITMAENNNNSVDMSTPAGTITIRPNSHIALIEPSDSQLRELSNTETTKGSIKLNSADQSYAPSNTDNKRFINVDALLWEVSLWSAQGRVPTGTDLTTPVYLKRWPNITRLRTFPHALRIAALWSRRPCSLVVTARMLDIPQRYVFSFFSAANALGLAATSLRSADQLTQPEPVSKHKKHGLFGRILASLRR